MTSLTLGISTELTAQAKNYDSYIPKMFFYSFFHLTQHLGCSSKFFSIHKEIKNGILEYCSSWTSQFCQLIEKIKDWDFQILAVHF